MNHAEARQYCIQGFQLKFGREPSLLEVQPLQANGMLESYYATAWKGAGIGSKNWGADQKKKPPCDDTSFLYTDSSPNSDGSSTPYSVCFWKFATDAEGVAKMCADMYGSTEDPAQNRHIKVLRAAQTGNLYGVSAEMFSVGYYAGFGRTAADRIANHHNAMYRCLKAITAELHEVMPSGKPTVGNQLGKILRGIFSAPKKPTLRRGSGKNFDAENLAVKDWQRFLGGLVVDGLFGPLTEEATIEWQGKHKNVITGKPLKIDGVVGTETWAAAELEAKLQREAA